MRKGIDYIGVTVSFFCHDGNGNFVMHKWSNKCLDEHVKWACGGGGLEFGLTVEENLQKEIMEEYCAKVLGMEFLGMRDVHRIHNSEKTHWIALDYKVLVDRSEVKIGEPEMCEDLKWFSFENLPEKDFLHSQLPIFLDRYREKLLRF
ncbi:NUDIX domain-containing protein [Candidatus Peregrinibacteria bacterium]|nr:NUDIX domain-containing protein [Candidatus Peregrinibacteria bacterium]